MTVSAAQAATFYTEVLEAETVWAIRDREGFPAPQTGDGRRAMPFWSKHARAERVINSVAAYATFEVVEVPLSEWRSRWLPGLERDSLLVGLNWTGPDATGYDVEPASVQRNLLARLRP
jgi:Protein of unknown function (DUF2750)